MTQLYSLADLVENEIEIRSLRNIVEESKINGAYRRYKPYFEIEKRLINEGKAVNLESYLLQEYQFNLRSITSIAKELGVSYASLYNLMYNLSIPIRTPNELKFICGISDETKQKMSEAKKGDKNPFYGKKGKEHPCYGRTHVMTLEQRENISRGHLHGVEKPSREELNDNYITKGKTAKELSEDYHVHHMTISKWLKHYGITIKSSGERRERKVSEEKIREVCNGEDLTVLEKAGLLGISYMTLYRRQKELGIKSTRKKREYVEEISI